MPRLLWQLLQGWALLATSFLTYIILASLYLWLRDSDLAHTGERWKRLRMFRKGAPRC